MKILMMTNTYKPILGGLEKSIESFSAEFRKMGHRVIIVAPEFEGMTAEEDVIRIPSIQKFYGTDFSVQLPIPGTLVDALGDWKPDIVHSHHPFLVGDTALRMASKYNVPLVFTHHTLYEKNTHYIAKDSDAIKRFVVELSTGYANLADQVFAPSQSVMDLLRERGVNTPIEVVPTGIHTKRFLTGDGKAFRSKYKIPAGASVIGHLGRLAPEKNLEFTARAVAHFMRQKKDAHFLVVGKGPSQDSLVEMFRELKMEDRLHLTGPLKGRALVNAYHAMDVFVFASQSETQGLVLAESMSAGVPVVAVDAPGVRDIIQDKTNGCLVASEDVEDFSAALKWILTLSAKDTEKVRQACLETVKALTMKLTAEKALRVYSALITQKEFSRRSFEDSGWDKTVRLFQAHWNLAANLAKAATSAVLKTTPDKNIGVLSEIQQAASESPLV